MTPKQVTLKVTMLLALTSITRGSEMKSLNLEFVVKIEGTCEFRLGNKVKHSKQGKVPPPVIFRPFDKDPKLCPVRAIDFYLNMSEPWRMPGSIREKQLLLCHINPHKAASKAAIARWIKEVLSLSGIEEFRAHSVRGASSSKGKVLGATITEILRKGNWKNESTWKKHYHKPILTSSGSFQDSLLSTALNEDDPAGRPCNLQVQSAE